MLLAWCAGHRFSKAAVVRRPALTARTRGRSGRPARACGTAPPQTPAPGSREAGAQPSQRRNMASLMYCPRGMLRRLNQLHCQASAVDRLPAAFVSACTLLPRPTRLAIHRLQLLQRRDDEHGGLAHARLGLADHIHAQNGLGDALVLHCGAAVGGRQTCWVSRSRGQAANMLSVAPLLPAAACRAVPWMPP